MIPDFFPRKENQDMSDEEWIDYCIDVWCCNSLNAQSGALRHRGDLRTAHLLERAQMIIMYLKNKTSAK